MTAPRTMPPHSYDGPTPFVGGLFTLKPSTEGCAPYSYSPDWQPSELTRCWLCGTEPGDLADSDLGLCDGCVAKLRTDEPTSRAVNFTAGTPARYGLHNPSPVHPLLAHEAAALESVDA